MLADDLHVAELVTRSNLKTQPGRAGRNRPAANVASDSAKPAQRPPEQREAPPSSRQPLVAFATSVVTRRWPVFHGREGARRRSVSTLRRRTRSPTIRRTNWFLGAPAGDALDRCCSLRF